MNTLVHLAVINQRNRQIAQQRARVEQQRLDLERQRLEVEEAEVELRHKQNEQVRELQNLIADATVNIGRLRKRDPMTPLATRELASIQSILKVLKAQRDTLREMSDITALRALEESFLEALDDARKRGGAPKDPVAVVRDDWRRVVRWSNRVRAALKKTEAEKARLVSGSFEAGERLVYGLPVRWIPAGRFTMGSPLGEGDLGAFSLGEAQHEVIISKGFLLAETQCTQGQWEAVWMWSRPSRFKGRDRPVEQVSWHDANDYCRKLTAKQRAGGLLPEGWEWRLPTEAEWEYAARAGTTGARHGELPGIAWYYNNSGIQTRHVKGTLANAWGLHGMLGNVWEWCSDWYGKYPSGSVTDPKGPSSGSNNWERVNRGGSFISSADTVRSAIRRGNDGHVHYSDLGFRPVLSSVR